MKRPVRGITQYAGKPYIVIVDTQDTIENTNRVTMPASLFQFTSNNSWFALTGHTHTYGGSGGGNIYAGDNISLSVSLLSTTVSVIGLQATSATSDITVNAFPAANTTKFAGTGTSATNATFTLNSNGLQISIADPSTLNTADAMNTSERYNYFYTSNNTFLTTAALSNHVHDYASSDHTHSQYQTTGNYLTTAMQSAYTSVFQYTSNTSVITSNALNASQSSLFQHTSATSAVTSLAMNTSERSNYQYTSNSSNNTSIYQALSATTKFAGTGTSATNATFTLNSNGLALSVAAPGAAVENNWITLGGNVASNSTASGSTIQWIGGNNITLAGTNNSQVRIDGVGTANALNTSQSSLFQHTSATSAVTSNALNTSQSSLFQHTSATSANTSAAFNTSASSRFVQGWELEGAQTAGTTSSSQGSQLYLSGGNMITLSGNSNTIVLSLNSASLLGTGATQSFLFTSQSSLFQHTSTTSAITANAMNTSERGNYFYTSNNTFANSTHSHGGVSLALTNINGTTASASNGLTLSLSANAGGGGIAASLSGNSTSAGAGYSNITSGTMILAGGNNITLSQNGVSITISGANIGGAQTGISGVGVSNTTYSSGTIIFSNQSNITIGSSLDGASQYVRLSVADAIPLANSTQYATTYLSSAWSGQTTANQSRVIQINGSSGTLSFATGSSLSLSSNASTITFGLASNITTALMDVGSSTRFVGINTSSSSTGGADLKFSLNSSGATFSVPAWMTSAYSATSQLSASFLNTGEQHIRQIQASNTTYTSGTVEISASRNASVSYNASTISIYGPASVLYALSVGGNTGTTGSSNISNSGFVIAGGSNVTLSQSNNSISIHALSQSAEPRVISINGTSGSLSFNVASSLSSSVNGSAFTFGLASNITTALQSAGAYLVTAAQSNQVVNSFNGSTGQISLVTGSGMSTTTNASTLTFGLRSDISTAWSGQTTANQSRVIQLNGSSGTLSFAVGSSLSASSNASTITFGLASNITSALQSANANYLTSQSNQAFSASGGSSAFQTLNFADSNGITFSNTNGSLRITHDLQYTSNTSAITASAVNTSERGNYFYTSNKTFAGTGTTIGATNGTLIKVTLNTDGLNISMPAYITTYAAGGSIDWSVATTNAGTDIIISTGVATNTLYHPAYITTAGVGAGAALKGSGTYTQNSGTIEFANSNDFTFGLTNNQMTASFSQSTHSHISYAATDHTHSDLYIAKGDSTAYQTGTLANTFMEKSYSSAFQTATLANTFMEKSYSSAFQTATLANTFAQVSASSAYQTATLSTALMPLAYSSGFQTATLSNTFAQTANVMLTGERNNYFYTSNKTFAGTSLSTVGTNGSVLLGAINTNGISLSVPAWITTAAGGGVNIAGSNTTYTSGTVYISGNNITVSSSLDGASQYIKLSGLAGGNVYYSDGSGISWGSAVNGVSTSITGSIQQAYYLSGANTSGTTSFSAGSALTLSGGNNITLSGNSNNQIVISAGAGGGGVAVKGSGTYSQNTGTVEFANSNGITFGLSNNGTLTASYDSTQFVNTGQGYIQSLAASNSTWSKGLVQISGSSNITASYNASTILLSVRDAIGTGTSTATTSATGLAVSGNTAGISITYPVVGYLSLINSNGYTWSSNVNGISTGIWLVLAHTA